MPLWMLLANEYDKNFGIDYGYDKECRGGYINGSMNVPRESILVCWLPARYFMAKQCGPRLFIGPTNYRTMKVNTRISKELTPILAISMPVNTSIKLRK